MKKLLVTIDENDADYKMNYIKIENAVFEKFLPLLKAINDFVPYKCISRFENYFYHNWPSGIDIDALHGEKTILEIYNQFSKEYIEEFKQIFLNFDTPYGFHTIVRVEDPISDEVYVDAEFSILHKKIENK